MKKIALAILALAAFVESNAQTAFDALRFSEYRALGTARFQSLGGAFGSLGGETSAIHLNPGTLGESRNNQYNITLGSTSVISNSKLYGEVGPEVRSTGISIGNLAAIFSTKISDSKWKYVSFGISYNRMLDYRSNIEITGTTPENSIADFAFSANGLTPDELLEYDPLYSDLAYQSEVINLAPGDPSGTSYVPNDFSEDAYNESTVAERGRLAETGIALGGNYDNKWFLGFEIGIPVARFRSQTEFTETSTDSSSALQQYTFRNNLEMAGSGFNFKLGGVYRASDRVRLGLAFHTPTYFDFSESTESTMKSEVEDRSYHILSDIYQNDYLLTTPSKFIASGSYIIGKSGFISVNYLTYNPRTARFRNSEFIESDFFDGTNRDIRTIYQRVNHLAVGMEYRVSYISFRGGYSIQNSPIRDEFVENNSALKTVSGGIGIKNGNYYMDFGFSSQITTQDYYLNSYALEPASLANRKNTFQFTLGYRFK